MAETVYLLCAATSVLCAVLLWRGYRASNRSSLLFWSSLCFAGFALNNVLLFVDLVVLPGYQLAAIRAAIALAAVAILLHGLVRESR